MKIGIYKPTVSVSPVCGVKVQGKMWRDGLADLGHQEEFALPSITEGVGMVALEAAANGAKIVLTNDGGPKYYLQGQAEIVNPYSVDEIGLAVKKLLDNNVYQLELLQYMKDNFSPEACSKRLEKVLIERL